MTERTGIRWSSAALIAPAAAAVFAGSMAWAAGHQPETKTTKTTSATPASGATAPAKPDPRAKEVEKLREQVAALQTELEGLESTTGQAPARKSSGSKVTKPRRPAKPKPTRAAAPPPPPADTSTGAS